MPKIVVHPSGAESDMLPARDALNKILDLVDMLVHSHAPRPLSPPSWMGGEPDWPTAVEEIQADRLAKVRPHHSPSLSVGGDDVSLHTALLDRL